MSGSDLPSKASLLDAPPLPPSLSLSLDRYRRGEAQSETTVGDPPMTQLSCPQIASSCPAYVAFCSGGTTGHEEGGLGRFGVPKSHLAGTPTTLENLDAMTLGSIDEGCHEHATGWESTDDEMQAAMGASRMEEDTGDNGNRDQDEEGNDDVFSFDFTPPEE